MGRAVLYLENISTNYENRGNLDHVTLAVEAGELLAVTSLDGSGISVLRDVFMGEVIPSEGRIYVEEKAVTLRSQRDANQQGIYLIHRKIAICPGLTVSEHLNVLKNFSWSDFFIRVKRHEEKTRMLFDHYGVRINLKTDVRKLSAVQCMMISIFRAVLCGAKILICQEVGNGCSASEKDEICRLFKMLKQEGLSIVLINSDITDMLSAADRVMILKNGVRSYDQAVSASSGADIRRILKIDTVTHTSVPEPGSNGSVFMMDGIGSREMPGFSLSIKLRSGCVYALLSEQVRADQPVCRLFSGASAGFGYVQDKDDRMPFETWRKKYRHNIYCMGPRFWEKNLFDNLTVGEHLLMRKYHRIARLFQPINQRLVRLALSDFFEAYDLDRRYLRYNPLQLPVDIRNDLVFWMLRFAPPKLLILDNPTYSADQNIKSNLIACLDDIKTKGTIVLWSQYNNPELKTYCDEYVFCPSNHERSCVINLPCGLE